MSSTVKIADWLINNYYSNKGPGLEQEPVRIAALVDAAPLGRLNSWPNWYKLKGLFTELAAGTVLNLAAAKYALPYSFRFSTTAEDLQGHYDLEVMNHTPDFLFLDIKADGGKPMHIKRHPLTILEMGFDPFTIGAGQLITGLKTDKFGTPAATLDLERNPGLIPSVRRAFTNALTSPKIRPPLLLKYGQESFLESFTCLGYPWSGFSI